jgi:hypothetical protein
MKNKGLLFILLVAMPCFTFAQVRHLGIGRASGFANAAVTLNDQWAIFNNVAGLAWIDKTYLMSVYDNRFSMSGFNTVLAGMVGVNKWGVAGGWTISQFGSDVYRETNLSLGLSHKLGNVSIGLRANYFQMSIEGLGTRRRILLEFGGVMQLSKTLWLGAHIYNFNQAKVADFQDERLPVVMKAGLSYRPTNKVMINLETEKDINFPQTIKLGIEYKIVSSLALRTGISTQPFIQSYGVEFSYYAFNILYTLSTHAQLLPSHQIGIAYHFRKLKKQENQKK